MVILNKFRKACRKVIRNPFFDAFILTAIFLNCIFLVLGNPALSEDSWERRLSLYADPIFVVLFLSEAILKWLALGIPGYFRDYWNWLDFAIVVEGCFSLIFESLFSTSGANISSLRVVRVLRPLRSITHLRGLRILVYTLLKSIPLLASTLLVTIFVSHSII